MKILLRRPKVGLKALLRTFCRQDGTLHPVELVRATLRTIYQGADVFAKGHVVSLRRLPCGEMLIWEH
uniref:hypothetical protein n=1 Tax=Paenarthrobacter ureafaciens TaxID=37931 RepID=UPI003F497CCB